MCNEILFPRKILVQYPTKALFSLPKNQKIFKILRHVESYDTCIEH